MRNILLHTIALEPARWTPERVSQPLETLLPALAGTGFRKLEVFEPHLSLHPDEGSLPDLFAQHGLEPVILSSYLNVNPARTPGPEFETQSAELAERVARFGFRKVRLFAGPGIDPADGPAVAAATERIRRLARQLPRIEFILETHDGSIADDPKIICRVVESIDCENVGLLYQPAVFQSQPSLDQLQIQRHLIRHFHLQNRKPDGSFAGLQDGVIPWPEILGAIPDADATIEFVAAAICTPAEFDLDKSVAELTDAARWAAGL